MRATTARAAPGENAIGCGIVYRGNLVEFFVLGCAPMRNRDICIPVRTYRSVNKCVHYISVLLPRRTRHVKYTLECTRSLGVESGRVSWWQRWDRSPSAEWVTWRQLRQKARQQWAAFCKSNVWIGATRTSRLETALVGSWENPDRERRLEPGDAVIGSESVDGDLSQQRTGIDSSTSVDVSDNGTRRHRLQSWQLAEGGSGDVDRRQLRGGHPDGDDSPAS